MCWREEYSLKQQYKVLQYYPYHTKKIKIAGAAQFMPKEWSLKQQYCNIVHTIPKQARKLERCATLRWNLRTAVKLAHSQNCRPQSRKKSKWNLCNCDCWKTCTETTANRRDGKNQRGYIQRSYSITQVGSTILPGRHRPFDTDMPRKRPFPSELF